MLGKSKIGLYFETILEIIEDKPNFTIPVFFYCFMIQILFHQIAGYIFSNFEDKPLSEQKVSFVAHINEIAPITFLLFFKGNDTLSLICFAFMQLLMYFYFIYVGILTYLKNFKKYFYQKNQKVFRQTNQFLNVFFTFYWWLFFTPYIEINSGMLVCGDNSFLVQFRGKSCSGKSPIITILSVIGLFLTITTAFIIVYFFRNYEFNEQNLLKRRFHFIILFQLVGRFLLTFFYYLNLPSVLVFKHIVAQEIGICFLYDTLMNWPFSNHTVAKFYSCASCIFEISIVLCNLWMFSSFMPSTEFFYYLVFLGLLSSALMTQMWRFKYETIMRIDQDKFQLFFKQSDFILEEMVRLLLDSQRDETSKFKLFEILIFHQKVCKDPECYCQKNNFKNQSNNDLDEEKVFKLIDSIFKWILASKTLQKNLDEFEHLSLKYISYLAKYRNNTSRAYYELKSILSQRSNISFYFKIISKILSKSIENQMEQQYIKNNVNQEYREDLDLTVVWKMEELKQNFVPKISQALNHKVVYWEKMKQGFSKMEDCMKYSIEKIQDIERLDKFFQLELSRMGSDEKSCYIYYKICSMFEILVRNQIVSAMKLELNANELRKRDQSKPSDQIHNFKLAKQQVISFLVSFSKDRGRIVSKKTAYTAKFFGYQQDEVDNIKYINDLMPKYISNIHNQLMENMNWKGTSKYIKGSIKSYYSDKNGFIYPIKTFLDHSFGHFDDFCLLSSVLKVTTSNDFIVFDETGKILGISESIYQKLFSSEKRMSIQKLYKSGFIFLLFKEIVNQISANKKEINTNYSDQQIIQITNTNKGYFNLNHNFDFMFDQFHQYMLLAGKELENSNSGQVKFRSKQGTKKIKDFTRSYENSSSSMNIPQLNLLEEGCSQTLNKFFEYYSDTKADLQNTKQFSNFDTGSQFNEQIQIRLFFKYQLQYECIKYNQDQKQMNIFHLILSDTAVSKRRVGSNYQSNMSLNTYINSTQVGGASSYRLKTFISKGGDTDLGGSVRLTDENRQNIAHQNKDQKQQQHLQNVLDTNNHYENSEDDENWEDYHQDQGSPNRNQTQNNAKLHSKSIGKKKEQIDLEHIDEAANKEEDSNKQASIKNDGDQKQLKAFEDLNISSQPTKVTNTNLTFSNKKKGNGQDIYLDKTSQNGLVSKQMLNDSILNESNIVSGENKSFLEASFQIEQSMVRNNFQLLSTTNRNMNDYPLSMTGRNNESQRPVLVGPDNLQAEFFSPQNNMRQAIDQDEIMITMDDQKNTEPPISLRFKQGVPEQQSKFFPKSSSNQNDENPLPKAYSFIEQKPTLQPQYSGVQEDFVKVSSLNPIRDSNLDDAMKNEDLEQDYQRIQKKRSLKDSTKEKKKKYSLRSENNLEDDANQQQSLASHSSIRSSYGTQFVREILNSKRLPNASKNFNLIQQLFVIGFIIIVLVNVFYLSQQITIISDDMNNYLLFANMTSSVGKGLMSLIGLNEIQYNLLAPNAVQNTKLYQQYLTEASQQFQDSFLDLENSLTTDVQSLFSSSDQQITFYDYTYTGSLQKSTISVLQLIYIFQNALLLSSQTSSQTHQIPLKLAYYQLRFNFKQFIDRMFTVKNNQDSNINNNISTINQIYIISTIISCIICFLVVMASIPMIQKINLFKEKVILLVTRIKVDEADVEISKYKQCIEELQDVEESYLNTDFFKIFTSKRKFHKRSRAKDDGKENQEYIYEEDLEHTYKVMQKNEGGQQIKQTIKKQSNQSTIKKSNKSSSRFKQNVISSKIFDQRLGLAKQFFSFLSYSFITIGFFIAILVFIVLRNNSITNSLNISQITLNTQYSLGALYSYSELNVIEKQFSNADPFYPAPSLSQRQTELGYQNDYIQIIQSFNQENINNIYGNTAISSSSISQIKDLFQNNLCNYFSQYSQCSNFNDGISGYITQLFSLLQSHVNIFDSTKFPTSTDAQYYISSNEHQRVISEAYIVPDQAIYLFNSIILDANIQLVKDMSLLVKVVYYVAGPSIILFLIIFFLIQWQNLKNELNSLSYLLTLIPEEKISEEITLQMLKQIRTF
ncbi:transmembrane protein, putative (macronuclear) [Tetrahymena thermophila SB210]|uniref:Transmembrane protein, putative n=1 Tax=Tetrahymena thermophila (strain SB210) TaxID=312017 RepID=Q22AP4_TETTS|nr:transmembrane protein, putative [Tetrahymena thermophila SB210]EAR82350.2 transmembrane protein, putative [Tetrahymena thermophila SB210]|eukprot:XP_001030013.2 transmembrane protein, putative [Tetrahymena thermophila SB210]